MQEITSVTGLKEAIRQLEERQTVNKQLFIKELHLTLESLRPINLIRSTINEAFSSPGLINNIFSAIVGQTAGYVSKKVVVGSTSNPLKKLFGTILQTTIAALLTKYGDTIRETAIIIFKSLRNKNTAPVAESL
jgi:hypothetical protein